MAKMVAMIMMMVMTRLTSYGTDWLACRLTDWATVSAVCKSHHTREDSEVDEDDADDDEDD